MICKRIGYIDKVFDGKTGIHTASIFKGVGWYCSCPAFYYKKKCKHLKELLSEVDMLEVNEILDNNADLGKRFPSSLNIVNNLFDDYAYGSNQITALYGKPSIGKTLLSIQEAVYLSTKKFNILFIDTEGSLIPMFRKWIPIFENRFGKRKGKIFIESKKTIENLMAYIGYEVVLEYKMANKKQKKGKLEFKVLRSIDNELEAIIKKNKIDFIILDSLTSPLRSFTKEQQNLPSRSDAIAFILRELIRLQEKYNLGILITHHASFNPADKYQTMADVAGGVVVQYYSKRLIYIDKREAKDYANYRRFWLVRGENSPKWSKAGVALIDGDGYHDVTDDDTINNVFTLTEQSKIENNDSD